MSKCVALATIGLLTMEKECFRRSIPGHLGSFFTLLKLSSHHRVSGFDCLRVLVNVN